MAPPVKRRTSAQEVQAIVRRYGIAAIVVVVVVVLASVIPSVSKTVTPVSATSTPSSTGVTPAIPAGTSGTTVGGVKCGPGIRQVPWSHYAPICEPKWSGNNGGATAPGVTKTTITLTYRAAATSELSLLYSIVPKSVLGTNTEAISTMQTFVKTFNQSFELYGRHVVLKPFVGKGDFVSELNGEDQTGAQEDAITAKQMGAFADSSVLDSTPIYEQALAEQKVVGISIFGGPDTIFTSASPYSYTIGNVCSKDVLQAEQYVGRVLNTTPTSFAGDPALNGTKRVFGFIGTGTAQSEKCNAQLLAGLKAKYGITVKDNVNMALSTTVEGQANSVMGQMKSDGVTTILCSSCDFFTPIFLTKAATTVGYHPEWIETNFLTALTALQTSQQIANAEGFGNQAPPKQDTEAWHAYELNAPQGQTIIPSYSYVYEPLLLFFDTLQAAGPDLTPESFQKGLRSLPASNPGGMYGTWSFNSDSFDPNGTYGMVRWSNTAKSAIDTKPGAWLACNGGKQYRYNGTAPQLPANTPVKCPSTGS